MIPLLDLRAQFETIREELLATVGSVAESQKFIMGEQVGLLEDAIADYSGAKHAVACASGTDALLLSFMVLDLKPGDEVITSPFTFFATAGAIHNAGGTPVFVDIEAGTFNIDPEQIEAAITPRTRAVVPVHLFGQMARMDRILPICGKLGLPVIEDAAQAIGARRTMDGESKLAGSLGSTGTFSFFPSKNLGGWGDGGMITTGDDRQAARLRRLREHGGAERYRHDEVGTNSRLDTLQAAVLLAKLPKLDGWSAARRAHAELYDAEFGDIPEVRTPVIDPDNASVYNQYTLRTTRRDELRAFLTEREIGSAVYYPMPLHLQPCFAHLNYKAGQLPVSEKACEDVISLPVYPELPRERQQVVIDAVRQFHA